MAKKPINVYRTPPPANVQPAEQEAPAPRRTRPPTKVLHRVQVYKDGTNKDRLSITQQVVEDAHNQKAGTSTGGKSRYEQLLNCIYDAVLITDPEGNIREVNSRAERYFLWNRDELRDGNVIQLISGADEQLLTVIRENVSGGKYTVLEAVCLCGDESHFNAEIVVNRMGDEDIAFIIRDITTRKKVEDDLRRAADKLIEAEKMQSRVDTLSTLFYELNNPLQILTCLAELDKNEEYRKQLDRIVSVLDHLRKQGPLETVVDEEVGTRYSVPPPVQELKDCDVKKIMVVDDEAMLREMFTTALKSALPGLTVDSVGDGKQAVDTFTAAHHGLIIMDVSMPVLNGEQAFAEIKAACEKQGYRMPAIIFCTGFVVSESLQAIINEDPSRSCLQKPLSINDLLETVKKHLSK